MFYLKVYSRISMYRYIIMYLYKVLPVLNPSLIIVRWPRLAKFSISSCLRSKTGAWQENPDRGDEEREKRERERRRSQKSVRRRGEKSARRESLGEPLGGESDGASPQLKGI